MFNLLLSYFYKHFFINEYFITLNWLLFFEANTPNKIIPAQINNIEIKDVTLNTTPRKIIDINVANKGPKPLNIG